MTKWFRRRQRWVWYVIVVGRDQNGWKDPNHVGPFFTRGTAQNYRNAWDEQFKGFATLDKRPAEPELLRVVDLNWKLI